MTFRPGERVEIAPHFDQWMRGDRYGEVVKESVRFGVYVKMDKSGRTLRFAPRDLTAINPRSRKSSRRKLSKRAARLMRGRRNPRYSKAGVYPKFTGKKNPRGRSENQAWTKVKKDAQEVRRRTTDRAIYAIATDIVDAADIMLSQLARGVHENPTLAVLGNPDGARVAGKLSGRLYEMRYRHEEDGKDYRHAFGPGACVYALTDGSVLVKAKHRLWKDF